MNIYITAAIKGLKEKLNKVLDNFKIAKKAIGVLLAGTLLAALFVIGNIEKSELREAGIAK